MASILAGFLACAVAVLACGIGTLRALRLDLNRAETLCLGYVLGFPIVSTLTFALAAFGVARKGVFMSIAVLSVVALARCAPWVRCLPPASFRNVPLPFWILFAGALAGYGQLYLRQALAPTTAPDALTYHLGFVNLWNHAHGFVPLEDIYSAMPEGMEMLFLFAFSIGRHAAAQLVHFSLLLLLPALTTLHALRFRMGGAAGLTAGILVFAAPIVGADGTTAYNDVALAAFALGAVWFLEFWRATKRSGALIASCLLAGFCLATKYTGAPFVALTAGVVLWECRRTPRQLRSRPVLASLALLALTCLPYVVRNAIRFQNPLAPFANSVFRNKHFHISFEQEYRQILSHPNFVTWRELPGELVWGGPKLFGHLGTAFLLAPVGIAGLAFPETRVVTMAALALGSPFFANKGTRFLIPMLPLLTLSMAFVIGRIPFGTVLLWLIAAAHLVLSWPGIDKGPGWRVDPVSWDVALQRVNEEAYLTSQLNEYLFARTIDRMIPAGEPVYSFIALPQAYMTHVRLSRESARGETVIHLLLVNGHPADSRHTFVFQLPAVPLRAVELRQSAKANTPWGVDEIELFSASGRIQPSPDWKVTARPFPWDARFAFDGNDATRWNSWEDLRPGMWIRADFPHELAGQKAIVFVSQGDWDAKMSLRVLTSQGKWIECDQPLTVMAPPLDRRRAATAAIRQLGFRYLVFSARDFAANLYYDHPEDWGLRTLHQSGDLKLLTTD